MALLDDIRMGRLLNVVNCSVYEAAAYLIINGGLDRAKVIEKLKSAAPGMPSETDIVGIVDRVSSLVRVWKVFREISEIAESFEYAMGKLVTVRTEAVKEPLERYLDEAGRAVEYNGNLVPADDRKVVRDGLLGLAGTKWYLVRIRNLLGAVGSSHGEVDWFWDIFGEFHHFDVIKLRNELVHSMDFEMPSSNLKNQIDWVSRWLREFVQKIRRTSIAVPSANGLIQLRFSTKEMALLPKASGGRRTAADALLSITIEDDPSSEHSLSLEAVGFDPETRVLQMPAGQTIAYAVLSNRKWFPNE